MLDLITTYTLNFKTIDFPANHKLEWYNGLRGIIITAFCASIFFKVNISERKPLNFAVVIIETIAIFRVQAKQFLFPFLFFSFSFFSFFYSVNYF